MNKGGVKTKRSEDILYKKYRKMKEQDRLKVC